MDENIKLELPEEEYERQSSVELDIKHNILDNAEPNVEDAEHINDNNESNNELNLRNECEDQVAVGVDACSKGNSNKKYPIRRRNRKNYIEYNSDTKEYLCPKCPSRYSNKRGLWNHIRIHNKSYTCLICSKTFKTNVQLANHRTLHVNEDKDVKYKCPKCPSSFPGKRGLWNHIRIHNTTCYTCSLCSEKFQTNLELINHKALHKNKETFLCESCEVAFTNHLDYLLHMIRHSNQTEFHCEECGKVFKKDIYENHLQIHFSPMLECTICGKVFKLANSLRTHMKWHDSSYRCGECGKNYKDKTSLDIHMASHTKVKLHQCLYCGKGFASQQNKRIHMTMHTDDNRRFECLVCHQKFRQVTDLNRHSLTHSKVRFACEYCGKDFSQKPSLVQHIRIHTRTNMFQCSECDRTFTTSTCLRSHVVHRHLDEKAFKCEVCSMEFRVKGHLNRHCQSIRHKNNMFAKNKKKVVT